MTVLRARILPTPPRRSCTASPPSKRTRALTLSTSCSPSHFLAACLLTAMRHAFQRTEARLRRPQTQHQRVLM